MRYRVLFVVLLGLLVCASVYADIPRLINFQGRLTDASGKFVSDGNYSLTFKIYSDSSGGSAKWSEAQSVAVSKGLFNVILGSQTPIPDSIFNYPNTWLGIQVGADPEMSPRQRLSSLGYAYRGAKADTSSYSMNSDKLDGLDASDFLSPVSDYGRSGVATDLYEGTSTLTSKYVNEGQASSVTSGMITDSSIVDADVSASAAIAGTKISPNFGSQNILTTGNVGIGTTSPMRTLHIASPTTSNEFVMEVKDGLADWRKWNFVVNGGTGNKQDLHLRILNDAGDNTTAGIMSWLSNGNVGIGTTTPNEQLEITGNLRLPASTATVGVIKSGANRFIHNFGTDNFFAGVNAGNFTLSGNGGNTGVGSNALQALTTGYYNTAVGQSALTSNTTGYYNTAVGLNALYYNTTGASNTAVGQLALYWNTTGSNNTAMGQRALYSNTTGWDNTAVGPVALYGNTTGIYNTAVGYSALQSNTTGGNNTAMGQNALLYNSTGDYNTAMGQLALSRNTTGYDNTAMGQRALFYNTTGIYNTAMGQSALSGNTTGGWNTAVGLSALYSNTTGYYNTAVGLSALYSNTTGYHNTAMGLYALYSNSTGNFNTAVGRGALYNTTTGTYNTAVGFGANVSTGGFDQRHCHRI